MTDWRPFLVTADGWTWLAFTAEVWFVCFFVFCSSFLSAEGKISLWNEGRWKEKGCKRVKREWVQVREKRGVREG